MKAGKKILKVLILNIFIISINSYGQKIDSLRNKFCIRSCNKYNIDKKIDTDKPPVIIKATKIKKIFSIPLKERLKIYPFNEYDTICTIAFNDAIDVEKTINHVGDFNKKQKKNITEQELDLLSNIMFNYYKFNNKIEMGTINQIGCDCPKEYPKLILGFLKNKKLEKYIVILDNQTITNFSESEYLQLDLNKEKEEMILKLFRKNINKNININSKNYLPSSPTPIPIK